jgi:hypothetical protein
MSVIKYRPIPFSPPMAAALRAGRKTQTRRIITRGKAPAGPCDVRTINGFPEVYGAGGVWMPLKPPLGVPGDRLYVKEPWRTLVRYNDLKPSEIEPGEPIWYEADGPPLKSRDPLFDPDWGRYRHARFMPRWASRMTLEITEVRAARVQDISEADAVAEGVEPLFSHDEIHKPTYRHELDLNPMPWKNYLWHGNMDVPAARVYAWPHQLSGYKQARGSYSSLWDLIHGPGAWERNDWVFAYTFKDVTP